MSAIKPIQTKINEPYTNTKQHKDWKMEYTIQPKTGQQQQQQNKNATIEPVGLLSAKRRST